MTEKQFYQQLGEVPPVPDSIYAGIATARPRSILRFVPISAAAAILIAVGALFIQNNTGSKSIDITYEEDQTEIFAYYDPLSNL